MPFSNFLDKKVLDHLFGVASYAAPNIYVGLSSTQPNADGTNVTEPTTGSYARVLSGASWGAASGTAPITTLNNTTISLPTATANWLSSAVIGYIVFYDAASSGNFLGWGVLTNAQPIFNTDQPTFVSSAISVSIA